MNEKRGEGEEEHDTVEGDAHTIISCIIFSMSCVLFLIVIVFVYDVVKYTKFGRNYLTVSCILKSLVDLCYFMLRKHFFISIKKNHGSLPMRHRLCPFDLNFEL